LQIAQFTCLYGSDRISHSHVSCDCNCCESPRLGHQVGLYQHTFMVNEVDDYYTIRSCDENYRRFDLEPDYIIRKPMTHRFQRYIVRTEIFSTFHARVEYIFLGEQYVIPPIQMSAHTNRQTHKSENSISARLGGYNNKCLH